MRICLLFLSLLLSFIGVNAQNGMSEVETPLTERCMFDIAMEKGHLSGIFITKDMDDAILGTMVNEFGITAISFIYDKHSHKIKLENVIGFLNKWYIKRVLKQDIRYCLHILYDVPAKDDKNYIVSMSDGNVTVTNSKRKITYSFSHIQEQNGTEE